MEKYCTNCGAPVGDSTFCTHCGTKVYNSDEATVQTPVCEPIPQASQKKSFPFFLKAILIILCGVLVWLAAITALSAVVSKVDSAINRNGTDVVDEKLLTVDIVIPAVCFSEAKPATAELTQEQKDMGFKSAKVNEDGSVTYTVSKKLYKTIKEETAKSTEEQLSVIPDIAPSVKSVEYNEDFSEIILKVDKAAYENTLDSLSVFQAGMLETVYQAYTGISADKMKTVVKVIDEATGEVISAAEYPVTDAK